LPVFDVEAARPSGRKRAIDVDIALRAQHELVWFQLTLSLTKTSPLPAVPPLYRINVTTALLLMFVASVVPEMSPVADTVKSCGSSSQWPPRPWGARVSTSVPSIIFSLLALVSTNLAVARLRAAARADCPGDRGLAVRVCQVGDGEHHAAHAVLTSVRR
jgi:hypothetical protein